jgi:beta-lactamase regulating signal transducer with metallopeptidase domain/tetratricopeptide (TPR) repeat protein
MRLDTYTDVITQALTNGSGLLEAMAWKSIVILALVAVATLLWRRGAAATRHLAWTTAFACLLCLPIFVALSSTWRAPVWIVPSNLSLNMPAAQAVDLAESADASSHPLPAPTNPNASANPRGLAARWLNVGSIVHWQTVFLVVWFVGAAVGLVRFLGAAVQLSLLARRASSCKNPAWLSFVDELRAEYRIGRRIRLLISDASIMPMTWGLWRPVVVLPAESSEWPADRLQVVLRHELAHVKRWDCLTQGIAHAVCVLYWFNPLTWFAARQMRSARELACDDIVLNAGARPSDYAGHLVEIAGQFTSAPRLAAVSMVRPSGLQLRVGAILDPHRRRGGIAAITAVSIMLAVFSLGLLVGSIRLEAADNQPQQPWSLDRSAVSAQLKRFVAEKIAQARVAAKTEGKELPLTFDPFFAAAARGDWQTVTNFFGDPERRFVSPRQRGGWWQPAMEINGTFELFASGDEKYLIAFGQDIVKSIPRGSIYFGGTDSGRFLVTALSASHVNADPFFTLTQNALADNNYVDYLRSMYGSRIAIPTEQDVQRCFQDYVEDAQRRMKENKLKPGEELRTSADGKLSAWGVTAVMEINGRIVKFILDKNPDREFYVEESYPLDWMYPYLQPHGLIMKLNRRPLTQLDPAGIAQDREFWGTLTKQLLADPRFLGNERARHAYAKLRSAIGGVYAYRKMTDEAEYAFKQALALGPDSPEANFRLARLYADQNRFDDAITVMKSLQQRDPSNQKVRDAISQLETEKQSKPTGQSH